MDELTIFCIALMVLGIVIRFNNKADAAKLVVPKERRCPPHAWEWVPIKNPDTGEVVTERITCKYCGPAGGNKGEHV
jgi:hypothetical protein